MNSEIPIIFLSARSLKEDILSGFKIGADDYITKPFSMEELVMRIGVEIVVVDPNGLQRIIAFKYLVDVRTQKCSRWSLSATFAKAVLTRLLIARLSPLCSCRILIVMQWLSVGRPPPPEL